MTDQRIEKWTRWVTAAIKRDVLTMHLYRHAWQEVAAITEANGQLPDSYWWEYMAETYGMAQAVAVRRQADTHKDVATLGKLIEEIRDDPSKISREWWLGLWDLDERGMAHLAEGGWEKHYAGDVGEHLDPAIPAADFNALRAAAADVKAYVDKHVAHADAAAVSATVTLTYKEIHDAIDVVGHLFKKYFNLLTADTYVELVPVIQHDWKAVFRQPWIRA